MNGLRGRTVAVQGGEYYVWERGVGTPLLLLHGFLGQGREFLPFFRKLSKYGRVLAIDLPGHGRTRLQLDPERFAVTSIAADIMEICERLEAEHPVIAGYSMGGRIALGCAMLSTQFPSALLLESASPGLETEEERALRRNHDETLAQRLAIVGLDAFLQEWQAQPLFASQVHAKPGALRRQQRGRQRQQIEGLAMSLRGTGTGKQPSFWERLQEFPKPVLLLTGEKDAKFTALATRMKRVFPLATHQIIRSAGHNVHLERSCEWMDAVSNFLQQL